MSEPDSAKAAAIERFEARDHTTGTEPSLPYRLLLPPKIEKGCLYPLILYLHGAGERGDDNKFQTTNAVWRFALPEVARKHPCIVVVPQCPKDRRWAEVDWNRVTVHQKPEPAAPLQAALEIVARIEKEFPTDPERRSVVGISMGGFGTWDVIARHPDRFAAAIPICGGGDTSQAPRVTNMNIWAFHGASDPVVSVDSSRKMIEALRKAGGSPRYTEYPVVGHNSWAPAFEEPEFFPWLLSQNLAGR